MARDWPRCRGAFRSPRHPPTRVHCRRSRYPPGWRSSCASGDGGQDRVVKRVRRAPAILIVRRRSTELFLARVRRIDADLAKDAAGTRRHDDDAFRQIDRLEHRVGYEDHGPAELLPKMEKVVVELETGDLV